MAVAKKKKRSRAGNGTTIPVAVAVGMLAGLTEPASFVSQGRFREAVQQLSKNYTGYDPVGHYWDTKSLKSGVFPLLMGVLVHKLAGRLGVNRALGSARIPFIRI